MWFREKITVDKEVYNQLLQAVILLKEFEGLSKATKINTVAGNEKPKNDFWYDYDFDKLRDLSPKVNMFLMKIENPLVMSEK